MFLGGFAVLWPFGTAKGFVGSGALVHAYACRLCGCLAGALSVDFGNQRFPSSACRDVLLFVQTFFFLICFFKGYLLLLLLFHCIFIFLQHLAKRKSPQKREKEESAKF